MSFPLASKPLPAVCFGQRPELPGDIECEENAQGTAHNPTWLASSSYYMSVYVSVSSERRCLVSLSVHRAVA